MTLTNCSTKRSAPLLIENKIWLPYAVERPDHKEMQAGFYHCESHIHLCMSYEDLKIHLENIKLLSEAHKSCVTLVKDHNHEIDLNRIRPRDK